MSKSASEQYQIKKKRKRHNNNHSSNNKLNFFKKRSPTCANENAVCFETLVYKKKFGIRDTQQTIESKSKPTTTTTTKAITKILRMPLSQGYYVKTALATKRNLKALKVGEAKRNRIATAAAAGAAAGATENVNNNNLYQSTTATTTTKATMEALNAATTTNLLQQSNTMQPQQQQQQKQQKNSLAISYLLGESLARCGSLFKAFDVYEIIASRQQDGYIPIDKLEILATALIAHVRQLATITTTTTATGLGTDFATTATNAMPRNTTLGGRGNYALETNLKSRFNARHEHALNWETTTATLMTTTPPTTNFLSDSAPALDLHAPSRELRIPSPMLSIDYDPLLCPLCRDILRSPVTTNCGHTFCRQCCETITMCNICHIKFPRATATTNVTAHELQQHQQQHQQQQQQLITATATTTASNSDVMAYYNGLNNNNNSSNNNNDNNDENMLHSVYGGNVAAATTITTQRLHMPATTTALLVANAANANGNANATPLTVTTTTVASTTATATTTMASTTSALQAVTSGLNSSVSAIAASNANGNGNGNGNGNITTTTIARCSADNMKFMPDVLVRRLVEKWWGAELQAKKINETAASYMHLNLLDDALKYCNASLEKSPTNFKSLCLRSEVLLKLNHYQSSLADVENALKTRYNSAKAHYLRALALSGLGRLDEALYNGFLTICLDKSTNLSSSEIFQNDLAKILQRLLAQTPKCKPTPLELNAPRLYAAKAPYNRLWEQCMRRRNRLGNISTTPAAYEILINDKAVAAAVALADAADEEDVFLSAECEKQFDYISATEEAEATLFASALDYMDKRDVYELHNAKEYELEARFRATRKHSRRKWPTKARDYEQELLPLPATLEDEMEDLMETTRRRCSQLLCGIEERVQRELQRMKSDDSNSALYKQAQLQPSLTPVPTALIDASDFDCVLCCRTLWKPVVTPCGHTYCLVCLDRCMDYNSACPLCMSPLVEMNTNNNSSSSNNNIYQNGGTSSPIPFALAKRPITKFLEAAMKRFIPDIYETRFRQEIDMEPSVPVFICTTAFPAVPCPLFVCEPRYRLMVRRAVESGDKTFGIVQPQSGKSRYFDIGTILDIRDSVLLGDGCFILSTIGCRRFKILARSEKDGYETAKVEYICDEPIADECVKCVTAMHALVRSKAIEWFDSLSREQKQEILQSFGEMPPLEDSWELLADGPAWAWWIIALLPLSQQLKVDILATTSLEKRLRAIEKTLDCLTGNYRNHAQQHQQQQLQQQQHQHTLNNIECDDDDDVVDVVDDVQTHVDVQVEMEMDLNDGASAVAVHMDEVVVVTQDVVDMNVVDVDVDVDECCIRTSHNVAIVTHTQTNEIQQQRQHRQQQQQQHQLLL